MPRLLPLLQLLLLTLLPLLAGCEASRNQLDTVRKETPETLRGTLPTNDRAATITFVLGEDDTAGGYYARATEYFRYHPQEAGDHLVTDLRTLREVHDYLRLNPSVAGTWQVINLVTEGNSWTGLATPVHPGQATRTYTEVLAGWKPARALPKSHLDEKTEIIVHGYNVGRDSALLLQLSRVFAARSGRFPAVSAAENFTIFQEGEYGMERYYAEVFSHAAPVSKYVQPQELAGHFASHYPGKPVDWNEALCNTGNVEELQACVYQFEVPVSWTKVYPAGAETKVPVDADAWLAGDCALMARLRKMGFTADQFRWEFSTDDHLLADGGSLPALTAHGATRVLCVLVPTAGEERMVRLRYGV